MNRPITAKVNAKGHLEIGGCDTADLAQEFGTPLYVMDETTLRGKCREYRTAFKEKYENSLVVYASKALCNTAVMRMVRDEGLGVDVSSGGELFTAKRAGCDLSKIYFHGNNKSEKEIEEALNIGVGRIVVDNSDELEKIGKLTSKLKKSARVLFRVNPGIEAHTHEFIQTGKIDSKFGIARENIAAAVAKASDMEFVEPIGLHSHIGSQIFDIEPFVAEIDILTGIMGEVLSSSGIRLEEINIGGGIGIEYAAGEKAPSIDLFSTRIADRLVMKSREHGLKGPKLVVEPGRSIVGNAGVTLYTIGGVKDIPGIRRYMFVDGGMADNPRPIMYGAKYEAVVANKADQPANEKVTVAGRFCESGDKLIDDVMLQQAGAKDLLAVFSTGAYNYSMASNYNRVPRPAMVLVNNGVPTLILKRETYEDLVQNDVLVG